MAKRIGAVKKRYYMSKTKKQKKIPAKSIAHSNYRQ